ncbi:MAG TPA: class I tRNA ligase family protein, partial [Deltaproteobacteria bacterium]|nr:class I tRNA ligase family protein [Deltaproteobacteria bacterium]
NIEGFDPHGITIEKDKLSLADKWILTKLNKAIEDTRAALEEYRYNDAADTLYQFTWHTFCDWFIELSKPMMTGAGAPYTRWTLHHVFKSLLEMLHPIIPFVTEEIWQCMPGRQGASIVIVQYPKADDELHFPEEAYMMECINDVVSGVRSIRGETNISPSVMLDIVLKVKSGEMEALMDTYRVLIQDLARVKSIHVISSNGSRPKKCALAVTSEVEVYVPLEGVIDIDKEKERLEKQINKARKELEAKHKKLTNKEFLAKAKKEIVEEQQRIKEELDFTIERLTKAHSLLEG